MSACWCAMLGGLLCPPQVVFLTAAVLAPATEAGNLLQGIVDLHHLGFESWAGPSQCLKLSEGIPKTLQKVQRQVSWTAGLLTWVTCTFQANCQSHSSNLSSAGFRRLGFSQGTVRRGGAGLSVQGGQLGSQDARFAVCLFLVRLGLPWWPSTWFGPSLSAGSLFLQRQFRWWLSSLRSKQGSFWPERDSEQIWEHSSTRPNLSSERNLCSVWRSFTSCPCFPSCLCPSRIPWRGNHTGKWCWRAHRHWCCMLMMSYAISTAVRLNSDLLVTSLKSHKGFQWYVLLWSHLI